MDANAQLKHLGTCLAGVFQNRQQALAEPAWFVHIRLWSHPVGLFTEDSFTFFLEQASAAFPQPPYRQRVLRIQQQAQALVAEYYALKRPQHYQGAAQAAERLQSLTLAELQPLVNSRLEIKYYSDSEKQRFEARQYPGERCEFAVGDETKFVELAFDVITQSGETTFLMYDKGIEPTTGKATWGALNGPFRLQKVGALGDL